MIVIEPNWVDLIAVLDVGIERPNREFTNAVSFLEYPFKIRMIKAEPFRVQLVSVLEIMPQRRVRYMTHLRERIDSLKPNFAESFFAPVRCVENDFRLSDVMVGPEVASG